MLSEDMRERETKKRKMIFWCCIAAIAVLFVVLLFVLIHFVKAKNHVDTFLERIEQSQSGKTTIGKLTDFSWEKGYCFLPYMSKEDMEKNLGFSSGKLKDNTVNDDVYYIVFVEKKKVVATLHTNIRENITFDITSDFTPESKVQITRKAKGKVTVSLWKENTSKKEKVVVKKETEAEEVQKQEDSVYSFLQGPKSWKRRIAWSGEWGESFYDGGSFGGFGCGLCCVANLYSTLTEYESSPIDAYRYAKKKTDYRGGGAIQWGYLRKTLSAMGFDCKVKKKPQKYADFQKELKESMGTIVLVSNQDSTCFWKDTPGHYVTVFLYDEKADKVFLADSGEPKRNRRWIALKKVYQSLKTSSDWQYLPVTGYDKTKDHWKHKVASGTWVRKE